jgi:hypothetical protein
MTTSERRVLRLHAGAHKTATSTLQAIMKMESEGVEPGFLYPKSGRMAAWPLAHHDLPRVLSQGDFQILDEMRAEIDQSAHRIIVLSCEDFCLPASFFAIGLIADRFSDLDIELHVAFRPYMSFLESYYLERAKRNSTILKPFDFAIEHLNSYCYSDIVNFFEASGLNTFYYEYKSPTFLADMYRALTGTDLAQKYRESHYNRAYSFEMTMFLRSFYTRRRGMAFDVDGILHAAWELENKLGFVDHKRPLLRHTEAEKIRTLLNGEHAFMKRRLGDMADRIYPKIQPYDDSAVLDPESDFAKLLLDGYFERFTQ